MALNLSGHLHNSCCVWKHLGSTLCIPGMATVHFSAATLFVVLCIRQNVSLSEYIEQRPFHLKLGLWLLSRKTIGFVETLERLEQNPARTGSPHIVSVSNRVQCTGIKRERRIPSSSRFVASTSYCKTDQSKQEENWSEDVQCANSCPAFWVR